MSVIIPVFNVCAYIEEALESVIGQTYKNLEILLIDDGSTDGSGDVCNQYSEKDSRIIVFHQENKGLSSARNVGLDHATGDVIAFLDPDDAYEPEMIEDLLEKMEHHQAEIVVCDFSLHRTNGKMENLEQQHSNVIIYDKIESLRKILDRTVNTAVWNKLYNKSIWNKLRFPEGHDYEGTYLAFDIFDRANKVVITNQKLVKHRIRSGSICNTFSLKSIQDAFFANDHYISFVEKNTPRIFTSSELRKVKEQKARGAAVVYIQSLYKTGLKDYRDEIRQMLANYNVDGCGRIFKMGYHFIMKTPYIGLAIYILYRGLRKIIRK